jgi:hypothetical protein
LPENEFSYVLQDWAQALGVEHAFARTAEVLCMILGLNLPVDSLERMNRKMSESVAEFRASRPAPSAKDEGAILVVTADNKGVPMRRSAEQLLAGILAKGRKGQQEVMAAVGCVYTVNLARTAETWWRPCSANVRREMTILSRWPNKTNLVELELPRDGRFVWPRKKFSPGWPTK